jgi:hypothetical protein
MTWSLTPVLDNRLKMWTVLSVEISHFSITLTDALNSVGHAGQPVITLINNYDVLTPHALYESSFAELIITFIK